LLINVANPGAIEAQEAAGQAEVVKSDYIPTDMRRNTREQYEALGFVFLGPVEGDDLFQRVTLPAGWGRKATSHAMYSQIVDAQGRERCSVFYKAAYYDRRAHISLEHRYAATAYADSCRRIAPDGTPEVRAIAIDAGAEVWSTTWRPEKIGEDPWAGSDAALAEATAWLDTNHPQWQSDDMAEAWA